MLFISIAAAFFCLLTFVWAVVRIVRRPRPPSVAQPVDALPATMHDSIFYSRDPNRILDRFVVLRPFQTAVSGVRFEAGDLLCLGADGQTLYYELLNARTLAVIEQPHLTFSDEEQIQQGIAERWIVTGRDFSRNSLQAMRQAGRSANEAVNEFSRMLSNFGGSMDHISRLMDQFSHPMGFTRTTTTTTTRTTGVEPPQPAKVKPADALKREGKEPPKTRYDLIGGDDDLF